MSHAGWGRVRFVRALVCGHVERRHYANGQCRECWHNTPANAAKRHAYYVAHKAAWARHLARSKATHQKLTKAYGISGAEVDAKLAAQRGLCALCGDPPKRKRLALDHDHTTGRVRDFLCHPCNGALGLFRDDIGRLKKAIAYLRAHRRRHSVPAAPAAAGDPSGA